MAFSQSLLGIGIDTGGTYTDAVVVDLATSEVLSKSKALTTPDDLRKGIDASLGQLDGRMFDRVRIVALSSTLATNSVVEGKGARVGLIMTVPNPATFSLPGVLPCERSAVIAGAHDRHGKVVVALDTAAAEEVLLAMDADVDAYAVSSYFSIYNSAHESEVREIISRLTGKPVVCAHELSGAVGMMERGTTAVLNAKLMPLMTELIAAVGTMLERHGIEATLMVIKGDGSMASAESCRKRPVETVLSGPAASVYGACRLSGLDDALVVDMGGTTSDIAMVTGGSARIEMNGARVGGWQTKVQAVDMWTIGLGGDSRVALKADGEIALGPRRSMPMSLAGMRFPALANKLRDLLGQQENKIKERQRRFYTLLKRPLRAGTSREEALLDALDGDVLSLDDIEQRFGAFVDVDKLLGTGVIIEISLTPTDVLHAQGKLDIWNGETARLAVELAARRAGLSPEGLVHKVCGTIHSVLARELAAKALHADPAIAGDWDEACHRFLDRLLHLSPDCFLDLGLCFRLPVIAVGAPVEAYLPAACRLTKARLVIPPHAEVANAYGAVTGKVVERAEALVRPLPSPKEGFEVVGPSGVSETLRLEDALRLAGKVAGSAAEERVQARGGCGIEVGIERDEMRASLAEGWGDDVLLQVRVVATAVGVPTVWQSIEEPLQAIP